MPTGPGALVVGQVILTLKRCSPHYFDIFVLFCALYSLYNNMGLECSTVLSSWSILVTENDGVNRLKSFGLEFKKSPLHSVKNRADLGKGSVDVQDVPVVWSTWTVSTLVLFGQAANYPSLSSN